VAQLPSGADNRKTPRYIALNTSLNALTGAFERRPAGRRFYFGSETSLRCKTQEDRQILELLDPVAEAAGYAIVRVRLMGGERRRLQVMAERPSDGDMGIDDCTKLSKAVSEVLDAAEIVKGEFVLEVSSPGIDRPLTRLVDFETYEGFEVRLELDRLAEGRKRFKGELAGVEDGNVAIDLEGEDHTALIPFGWIIDAKLVMTDALMKRGADLRANRIEQDDETLEEED
jgi:ribosome maturation factor RimP